MQCVHTHCPEWVGPVITKTIPFTSQCPGVGHLPRKTTKDRLFLLCLLPMLTSLCPRPFAHVSSSPALSPSLYLQKPASPLCVLSYPPTKQPTHRPLLVCVQISHLEGNPPQAPCLPYYLCIQVCGLMTGAVRITVGGLACD